MIPSHEPTVTNFLINADRYRRDPEYRREMLRLLCELNERTAFLEPAFDGDWDVWRLLDPLGRAQLFRTKQSAVTYAQGRGWVIYEETTTT